MLSQRAVEWWAASILLRRMLSDYQAALYRDDTEALADLDALMAYVTRTYGARRVLGCIGWESCVPPDHREALALVDAVVARTAELAAEVAGRG